MQGSVRRPPGAHEADDEEFLGALGAGPAAAAARGPAPPGGSPAGGAGGPEGRPQGE